MHVNLARFSKRGYHPGASVFMRGLWYVVNALLFHSWLVPLYAPKSAILRAFGARVGRGVVIKPRVSIKYPWRLGIGDHVWIGEGAWIDNLADVTIGSNVCISQDAYLFTGNHDYKDAAFGLVTEAIAIEDGAWVGARATICPGVRIGEGSVVCAGGVVTKSTEAKGIYAGNPATRRRTRSITGGAGGEDRLR